MITLSNPIKITFLTLALSLAFFALPMESFAQNLNIIGKHSSISGEGDRYTRVEIDFKADSFSKGNSILFYFGGSNKKGGAFIYAELTYSEYKEIFESQKPIRDLVIKSRSTRANRFTVNATQRNEIRKITFLAERDFRDNTYEIEILMLPDAIISLRTKMKARHILGWLTTVLDIRNIGELDFTPGLGYYDGESNQIRFTNPDQIMKIIQTGFERN